MSKQRWIVGLLLGAALAPSYWFLFVRDPIVVTIGRETFRKSDLSDMRRHGVAVDDYLFARQLFQKTKYDRIPLRSNEWDKAASIALFSDSDSRYLALYAIGFDALLGDRATDAANLFRSEIAQLAARSGKISGVSDDERVFLRQQSLRCLCDINARGWQQDAQLALNDPLMADVARDILK